MSNIKLFKDTDGNIYQAKDVETIDRKHIKSQITHYQAELLKWEHLLEQYNQLTESDKSSIAEDDGDGHIKFDKEQIKRMAIKS